MGHRHIFPAILVVASFAGVSDAQIYMDNGSYYYDPSAYSYYQAGPTWYYDPDACFQCPEVCVTEVPCVECKDGGVQETRNVTQTVLRTRQYQAVSGPGGLYAINVSTGAAFKYDDAKDKWNRLKEIPPDLEN